MKKIKPLTKKHSFRRWLKKLLGIKSPSGPTSWAELELDEMHTLKSTKRSPAVKKDYVHVYCSKETAAALEKVPTYEKIIAMFNPIEEDFLNFKAEETIQGPNDRALYGFDTNFPLKWLVEDYGFTEEEARWFIAEVHRLRPNKKEEEPSDAT